MKILLFLFLPLVCFGQLYKWDMDTVQYYNNHVRTPDQLSEDQFTCLVSEFEEIFYNYPGPIEVFNHTTRCIKIYIETDFATVQLFNGDRTAVQNWINIIEVDIKKAFAFEELNVSFSEVLIPTSAGWADAFNNPSDILYNFGKHRAAIDADLKHFITRRNLGGGVAWLNTLCSATILLSGDRYAGPYGVSTGLAVNFQRYPIWSWTIGEIMHELGHNLGSRHTHACAWGLNKNQALDDCRAPEGDCTLVSVPEYSTTMSYCHLISKGVSFMKGYGIEPGQLIRTRVSTASCLEECTDCLETLTLTGNISGTYRANTINLDNVNSTNLTLHANILNIKASNINPIFVMNLGGCN